MPDSVIDSARREGETVTSINAFNGTQSTASTLSSLKDVGEARGQLLSFQLDKVSDSVKGQSVVNKEGYLTDLASIPINSEADIGDFKKARLLLKNVITTNPSNPHGWVAAARVEELDGKLQAARNIIA